MQNTQIDVSENFGNLELFFTEFYKVAKQYELEYREREKELWFGRTVRKTLFSWTLDLGNLKKSSHILKVIRNIGKNLKSFEIFSGYQKFFSKDYKIELILNYSKDKTTTISLDLLQPSKKFKTCLSTIENKNQYLELFSNKSDTLKINRINEITFSSFFSEMLETGIKNHRFKINGTKIFASEDLKEISIVIEKIGNGGLNRVYKVFDLLKKENRAIRKTHLSKKQLENKDPIQLYANAVSKIKAGIQILQKLNKNGDAKGIPPAPTQITLFESKQKNVIKSFVSMELASCSLLDIIRSKTNCFFKLGLKKQLCLLKDVFEDLVFTHKLEIAHCDIKPGNLLITTDENNKITKISISDWDGAVSDNINSTPTFTAKYFPCNIYKNNTFTLPELKRCDLFALSLTFAEVLLTSHIGLESENIYKRNSLKPLKFPKFFDQHKEENAEKLIDFLRTQPLMNEVGKRIPGGTLPEKLVQFLLKGMRSDAPDIELFFEEYKNILDSL